MRAQGVIIGAGIVGSAVAYELSRRGISDLHVLDPDLEGSLSSTERNAGGVRHLWQHPVNVELARASISLFEKIKTEIGFQQSGYLWLYSPDKEKMGRELLEHTRRMGLKYEALSFKDVQSRYPFIDKQEDLAFGIFGEKDGLINPNALKMYFRREASKRGVHFHDQTLTLRINARSRGVGVTGVQLASQNLALDCLKDPSKTPPGEPISWEADFTVLTAGAWTKRLLGDLIPDPQIEPVRRQISIFKAENFDMSPYGMVVDTSRVYFHPEGGNILAGFVVKSEAPGFRFDYDDPFFEEHIWPALYQRSTRLERLKPVSGWGGLYSYTPDTSGILGPLPGHPSIYEAHSFTGRGLMQSYGAAVALSELILDGKFSSFDASSLDRSRFATGNLLREDLHI